MQTPFKRQFRKEFRHRPVLSTYDFLFEDLWEIANKGYTREDINKEDTSSIPVSSCSLASVGLSFQFWTIRNNESVEVKIAVRELELRFYDNTNLVEYFLEISVNRKLANPEKLQQDFSIFLATEKHLLDFIVDTIWPHIDASVKKEEQRVQLKIKRVNHLNREAIPREPNPRYSLRTRKNEKEFQDDNNSRVSRRLRKTGSTR